MRRENDPIGIRMASEEPLPRRSCRGWINAKPGAPVRIPKLQRMMHEVGAQDRLAASAFEPDHKLAWGVAVRRLDDDAGRNRMLIIN